MRGIAIARMFFDLRSSRITESEKFGDFVERFAGGVVHRSADQLIIAETAHEDRHRMPAADDERDIWFDLAIAEKWREQMAFEMIDCEVRLAKANGQTFGD